MKSVGLLIVFLLGLATEAQAQDQEISLSHSFGTEASFQEPGTTDLRLDYVHAVKEAFSLLYGYGYAQANDHKTSQIFHDSLGREERNSIDAGLHSLRFGAQQVLGHQLVGWSALTLSAGRGKVQVKHNAQDAQSFPYEALLIQTQTGFGQRWNIGENFGVGIDWLIFSISFHRSVSLDSEAVLRERGPFYRPKTEVKDTLDALTRIRILGLHLSVYF